MAARVHLAGAIAGVALAAAGCAPTPAALVAEPLSPSRRWLESRNADHPLVGKIWDVRAGRLVDEEALAAALRSGDFVLLGEVHDNRDHHLLQARLLRAVVAGGRRPALAFEMMDEDVQPRIDEALARAPHDPEAVRRAVDWDHSGWYGFANYRPIFTEGLAAGTPIVAANVPRDAAKAAVMQGPDALSPELRTLLAREEPLPAEVVESLRAEMRSSHCDAPMPENLLDRLALAQRARDAQMARRLLAAGASGGAVLITGDGHVRRDRGVPATLAREAPGRSVVAVAIEEVTAGRQDPREYAAAYGKGPLPFDFVVFTPGAEREDPCEKLKGHHWEKPAVAGADAPKNEPGAAADRDGGASGPSPDAP